MALQRRVTAFDALFISATLGAAVLWMIASGPGLAGLSAIPVLGALVVVVLMLVAAGAWEFLYVTRGLFAHYDAIIGAILLSRRDLIPRSVGPRLAALASALLLFLIFFGYFLIMVVFFYGLGGALLANPSRLMIAAFLGTSVLHLAGRSDIGRALAVVLDFLVPFGLIVGLIDVSVVGSDLPAWASQYAPVVLVFFAAYYGLDAFLHRRNMREGEEEHGLAGAY